MGLAIRLLAIWPMAGDKLRKLDFEIIFNPRPANLADAMSYGVIFIRFFKIVKGAAFGTDHSHDAFLSHIFFQVAI